MPSRGESLMIVEHHSMAFGRNRAVDDVRPPVGLGGGSAFFDPNGSRTPTGTGRVRKHAIRQAAVLEVGGRLRDVVHDLDRAIQLALADGPRGVVCDLTNAVGRAGPDAVEVLATAGRHVRDWPGVPVVVASRDLQVSEALRVHPRGRHLIVATSLFTALSAVVPTPTPAVEWLQLAPHPTAPRASRDFVTRTLLDWRLGRAIRFARLVVGELVMSSTVNASTDIDLSVAWNQGALRLAVRDHGHTLPDQQTPAPDLHGRGLAVVAGLSRSFGALPTADGGKVVWAVLNAPRPRRSNSPSRLEPASAIQEWPSFADARGVTGWAFCAGPRRQSPHSIVPRAANADHTSAPLRDPAHVIPMTTTTVTRSQD